MNSKDQERVKAATQTQQQNGQPQSEPPNPAFEGEVNGAKVRSMLRKKAVAAQAVTDAYSDAECYAKTYNAALEGAIAQLTIGNVESSQAVNNQANAEINQDFFRIGQNLNEAMNRLNNYQIALPSGSRFLLNSSSN